MEVRLLGPVEIVDSGRSIPLGGPRQRTVLGVLALTAGRVVSVDRLVDAVWDRASPPTAEQQIRTAISSLRRVLGDGIVTSPPGYKLLVGPDDIDLLVFDRRVASGHELAASGRFGEAAEALRAALALWRGPALGGAPGLAAEAARLEERRLGALEDRIEADLRRGSQAGLVDELHWLVAQQPLRERLWGQLMLALYRSNRQAEALAAYHRLRDRIVEELGVEPGRPLQALQRRILAADPALDPSPDPPAAGAAGAKASSRAGAGAVVTPRQLLADIAMFTGRSEELAWLDQAVAADQDGSLPIAVIHGKPGVGKTALAVHWAHRVADRFGDGQLCINLQGYAAAAPAQPVQALGQLLRSLGVEADKVPTELDEAAALYRSLLAGRRALVVLDDARDAEQVRPLLPGSPGCAVLITSRDRLDGLVATHGVQQIPLRVLGTDEGVVMLARILGAKRVEDQAEAARQLVRMCGHLPLALRVAAANLTRHPEQPIDGYLAELWAGDRLAGLAIDGDPRAAVRGTFDLSSQRLSPEARRMFRCLGLAPGPDLTADAAAALAAVPTAESARLLDRLAGVHLVEQPAVGRFALHDLLRLYAAEKAAHEDGGAERNAVVERLLAYYLRAADRAAELLYPQMLRLPRRSVDTEVPPPRFDDPAGALAWLDAERINLVAAIQHRADHPLPAVWLLADTLRGYFYLRRHTVDWLAAATAGVTAAGGNPSAQAAGHLSLALLKWCQIRPQAAIEEYRRALALAGEGGWVEAEVRILTNIGLGYGELGDLRRAADSCARAAELSRKAGLRVAEATALGNLGTVSQQLGNLEPAADYQARALALYREIGSRGGEANSLENLGEINHALGRLDRAAEAVSRALALNREVGSRYGEAYDLDLVAVIHLDAGRIAQALDSAHAALRLAREIGARQAEATTLNTLGTIRLRSGDDLQATEHYRQALDLAREVGSRWPEVTALIGLASAGRHPGEHAAAGAHARQALDLARHAGFRILQGNALVALAGIHLAQGHTEQAIELARQALAAQEATGHRLGRARALAVLGHALHHAGSADAASARWDDALALLAPAGSPDAGEIRALMKRHHVPGTG